MTLELFIQMAGVTGAVGGVLGGGYWALGKMLMGSYEKRLDERFNAQDKAREEGKRTYDERAKKMEEKQRELEKDVRQILIELPRDYVARADYMRRETLIEAKIDQLSLRIENWMLRGGKHD